MGTIAEITSTDSGCRELTALPARSQTEVKFTFVPDSETETISVTINASNTVPELDLSNNSASRTFGQNQTLPWSEIGLFALLIIVAVTALVVKFMKGKQHRRVVYSLRGRSSFM